MKAFEARIEGRVQRVMFRDFARRKAARLGLTGTVENAADGTVRVVAEGKEAALEQFAAWLHHGSPLAKVAQVALVWREYSGQFTSFTIQYRSLWDRL
jgi:acylphosphatase